MLSVNLNNVNSNMTSLSSRIDILHIHIQIENGLQQIYDKVSTLETAITFATSGILHPSIVDPVHLLLELIQIGKQYTLPVEARRENMHLLETSITVKAYCTANTLTFILEIPLVSQITYDLLHLYSIPNDQNVTRIPKSPTLVLSNDRYTYLHETCLHLTDKLRICEHLKLQEIRDNPDCIVQTIQHIPATNCEFAKVTISTNKIQRIEDSTWLAIIPKEDILKTTCINNDKYQRVRGTYLLTTTDKCIFTLDGKILQTHHRTMTIQETLPLPRMEIEETNITIQNLRLEKIGLDTLHSLAVQAQANEATTDFSNSITTKPSWTSIIALAAIVIAIIYFAYRKFRTNRCKVKSTRIEPCTAIEMEATPRPENSSTEPTPHRASPELHRSCNRVSTIRSSLGREELCRLSS